MRSGPPKKSQESIHFPLQACKRCSEKLQIQLIGLELKGHATQINKTKHDAYPSKLFGCEPLSFGDIGCRDLSFIRRPHREEFPCCCLL